MFVDELPEMPTVKVHIGPIWAFEGGLTVDWDLRKFVQEHHSGWSCPVILAAIVMEPKLIYG